MELVKIIQHDNNRMVSGKDLHTFLEINSRFDIWIKRMIEYGFTENIDFQRLYKIGQTVNGNERMVIDDYAITLDMAKEISMIQRSEKGKQARQYFIDIEKKYKTPSPVLSPAEQLLNQAQVLIDQEKRMNALDQRQKEMEQKINELDSRIAHRPGFYSIQAFARLQNITIPVKRAAELGRKATDLSHEWGAEIDSMPDPRFGKVNLYKSAVLARLFETEGLLTVTEPEKPRGFTAIIKSLDKKRTELPW